MDQKAKDLLNLHPTNVSIPYGNFKSFINGYILNKWQILWNNSVGNKLFEIKPVIGQSQPVVRNVRQEEVVLARLRIGNTRITHSYLLMMMSWSLTTHQPFWVISVIKVIKRSITEH